VPTVGRVRQDRPEAYLKVVASLIPRQIEAEVTTETSEYRLEKLADKLADYEAERGIVRDTPRAPDGQA
jgi:hypothetical protein